MAEIGVIGGSGIYELDGLENVREERINTPYGEPSDCYITGNFKGKELAFLPRHGRGHKILPSEVNVRANIYGFKKLGVKQIIAFTAVGSLKEDIAPEDFVLPDQVIDKTKLRANTLFGEGLAVHTALARPFCDALRKNIYNTALEKGIKVHYDGTYVCMEGPQFSTRAESFLHKSWGASLIGMTLSPEFKIAREAEICYAPVALVTDIDCWHEEEEVDNLKVVNTMKKNVSRAKELLTVLIPLLKDNEICACHTALKNAIMTNVDSIDSRLKEKYGLFIEKYLK